MEREGRSQPSRNPVAGFGAPGEDLVSLAEILTVPAGMRFAFPEGPLSLSFGPSDAWPRHSDDEGALHRGQRPPSLS